MITQILIFKGINCGAVLLPCTTFKVFSMEEVYNLAQTGMLTHFKVAEFPSGLRFVITQVKAAFVCSTPFCRSL